MDARQIEDLVERKLKRMLGKSILVIKGPAASTKYSGIRPEVFIHISRFEDFNGIMPDGEHVTRTPVKGRSTFKGFEEYRPARLALTVTCVAGLYSNLQEICEALSPTVLLTLELLPDITLGALPDDTVQLSFRNFTACLHTAILDGASGEGNNYYRGELVFHLNGFIHVWITKRGGVRKGPSPTSKTRLPKTQRSNTRKSKARTSRTKGKTKQV